ncbi:MAG: stage III sporulation protein AA [Lachnospiraceae bacterium]|nr:stage III sporulation protein AA [Lachnospiraceae bacterium]
MKREDVLKLFPGRLRDILGRANLDFDRLQEIRLRVNKPLILLYDGREVFLDGFGRQWSIRQKGYTVTPEDISGTLEYISSYSMYAYEEELRQGYLTVQGGHRVGVAGRAVVEGEKLKSVQYISFINVRIAHQIPGCAEQLLPYVVEGGGVYHTLIVSAPRCGKTTLLRELIRRISDGTESCPGLSVGVVDERSEIGGCYLGIPQNDLGVRTDVLDGCPKAQGMMMLVRSMSPAVIAVDEIATGEDIRAVETVAGCGCKILATVHGSTMEDVRRRPMLEKLVAERIFERYVILDGAAAPGRVREIYDGRGTCLYDGRGGSLPLAKTGS